VAEHAKAAMETFELQSGRYRAQLGRHGAQLLCASCDGEPLVWLSPQAQFDEGKAIRGGVPLCFPWFGKHPDGLPAHGFARLRQWALHSMDATSASFTLDSDADTLTLWPHVFAARLAVQLHDGIELLFEVENRDVLPLRFSYALHSYFAVGGLQQCAVDGLDGRLRKEVGHVTSPQQGLVTLSGPIDAIFEQAPGKLRLVDGDRAIAIESDHMRSAVVWNPGGAGEEIADIGVGWPQFLCVERGNIGSAAIVLAPGEVHRGVMRIEVEKT
jgi:D-hexose-6-phosphate mutarotase